MVPGKEVLLIDTGAVKNLTGNEFVIRMADLVKKYNLEIRWADLNKPQIVGGVGTGKCRCTKQAYIPCCLSNGMELLFPAPVIPGNPSPVPPLYGLKAMAEQNVYFSTRHGTMMFVPEGRDKEIQWPKNTQVWQCEKAPSGHWLLIVSEFAKKRSS